MGVRTSGKVVFLSSEQQEAVYRRLFSIEQPGKHKMMGFYLHIRMHWFQKYKRILS